MESICCELNVLTAVDLNGFAGFKNIFTLMFEMSSLFSRLCSSSVCRNLHLKIEIKTKPYPSISWSIFLPFFLHRGSSCSAVGTLIWKDTTPPLVIIIILINPNMLTIMATYIVYARLPAECWSQAADTSFPPWVSCSICHKGVVGIVMMMIFI